MNESVTSGWNGKTFLKDYMKPHTQIPAGMSCWGADSRSASQEISDSYGTRRFTVVCTTVCHYTLHWSTL